ncbi:Outer membrane protein beta-barrel domain-containing protein [Mucilaginibacter mallensis]|uniref:Outer membrane protein beta-barrel domain-containing protein n=1 Tax=Mucilaginibacter mallensis TaxID=652787 RepID=A0A1H2BPH5_MUCMA|nr:porin family protein [Mucilaginibacter mallensis]SDT60141.1 Outer membrane protein beta-barrel domain-containing protein [Mucilaginibacter mallensis]
MKKLLLTTLFTISTIIAFAQSYGNTNNGTITFGLAGGTSFAFIQVKSPYRDEVYTNSEAPFSLGFNADFKFNDYFSIRPGILYAGKGGTMNAVYVDQQENNISVTDDYKLHYLEIPIAFIGHLPVGDGANIYLGAGPYFSLGLNGTNNQTLYTDDPVKQKITYGKNGDFKSTDVGATGVLGFQGAAGWTISGNLDWGFTNILQKNNTGYDVSEFKTITFYLSIGQSF